MSKSIKKFQQDIDNIEIPENELKNAIKRGIDRGDIRKLSSKRLMYVSSIAVVLATLLLGSGFVSPTMAKVLSAIPYLSSVLPFNDKGLEVAGEKGLIESVEETTIDQGIPITITDVYYDNSRMEIGYYIPLENVDLEGLSELEIIGISKANILLDGIKANGYSASNDYKEDFVVGTFEVYTDFSLLSENPKIELEVIEALGREGQWLFEFESKKASQKASFKIDNTASKSEYKFTVKEMEITPSTTGIKYELEMPPNPNLTNFNPYSLVFHLYDEGGSELELIKTGTIRYEHSEEHTLLRSELYFEPILEVNSTIIPSIKDDDGGSEQDLTVFEMKLQSID
jgi:hypothetical protein